MLSSQGVVSQILIDWLIDDDDDGFLTSLFLLLLWYKTRPNNQHYQTKW